MAFFVIFIKLIKKYQFFQFLLLLSGRRYVLKYLISFIILMICIIIIKTKMSK